MNYTIINGNCMDELPRIIEKLKEEGRKYILVSDPPFNIGYHYKDYNDNQSEEDYFNMLQTIFENEFHVLIHYPEVLHKHSWLIGDFPEKVVSWVYNSNTAKQHRDIAFYGVKPDFRKVGQPYKNPTDKRIQERIKQGKTARIYDWWEINQVKNVSKDKTEHPCQMPIEVMDRIIGILPDDVVIIDPFMGSGSTGVSCVHFNKDFIGIDIDKEYCKIAVGRIQSAKSQTQLSAESCPKGEFNRNLKENPTDFPKCPTDTSLNSGIHQNFPFALQSRVQHPHADFEVLPLTLQSEIKQHQIISLIKGNF